LKPLTKAHLAVLVTNLIFASNYGIVKYISPSLVKPNALNLLRVGISLALFWLLWLLGRILPGQPGGKPGIKKEHTGRFLLCALTGVVINQTLFIKGLTMTSTIHASLLILCTPLLITIFAFWILKEKLTALKAVGLALGIGGSVLLIIAKESLVHAGNYLLGDILIIINAVSYAFYFILVKPLMKEYNPVHVIRWVFTLGFLMIIPLSWVQFTEIQWQQFEWTHFASLAFIVFFGTFLAYYFNIYGIQHLGAGVTGSYIYTQPIFAAIIATLLLHEPLTIQKIVAGIMIFAGVFLVSLKRTS
jgi:drug/metabolite transporter (DMT)-like permease